MKGLDRFEPSSYYHIVNHAVGSENLFRTDDNFEYFLKKYAHHMFSVSSTLCYCLMPNHIHFLVKTLDEATAEKHPKFKGDFHKLVMQQLSNLLNAYAKAFNKKYERRGALWIDYTKRFKIDHDSYLTSVINYIHQNPVKHGFTKGPSDWIYSSYHSHTSDKHTLLARAEVLDWFGGKEEYLKFHTGQTTELIDDWEY